MGKYLITGYSGSGKSTLCRELQERGLPAFDTDANRELVQWYDARNGEKIGRSLTEKFDPNIHLWNWDESVINNVLGANPDVVLCGSADNALDFFNLFDAVFVLSASEKEQRRRMMARTEHNFGQDIETQDSVIAEQRELIEQAKAMGAVIVDASGSPSEIADSILGQVEL